MSIVDLARTSSSAEGADQAANELLHGLTGAQPKLALVFAPGERDHVALAKAIRSKLPASTKMLYASSGAPIGPSGASPRSVVLAALSGDLEVGLGVGKGLTSDPVKAGSDAAAQAASALGIKVADIDPRNTVGIVIDDGARSKKEELLLGILDANPALPLVGGGAGDGRMPGSPSVAAVGIDGEAEGDAAVLALIRTNAKWATLRHHAYRPTGDRLLITKVDDTYQRALEIDGKPAAQAYADLLGVTIDDLEFGKPKGISDRPTAMRVGREYFLRAAWRPLPDGSLLFANRLIENTELEVMKMVDFVPALQTFLSEEIPSRVGVPTGALYFNCYGRYMMAHGMGLDAQVDAAYASGPPAAGLNAVFEAFNGFQINSTLTALAFGRGS